MIHFEFLLRLTALRGVEFYDRVNPFPLPLPVDFRVYLHLYFILYLPNELVVCLFLLLFSVRAHFN